MGPITSAGGSLSSALTLTAIAWGIRLWREEMNRRKAEKAELAKPPRVLPKYHALLSRSALRLLVRCGDTERGFVESIGQKWSGKTHSTLSRWCGIDWHRCAHHQATPLAQVEAGTVPFIIFDVRRDASGPLPTQLRGSIRLPCM